MWRNKADFLIGTESVDSMNRSADELVQITVSPDAGLRHPSSSPGSYSVVGDGVWRKRIPVSPALSGTGSDVPLCTIFSHVLSYPDTRYKGWVELCAKGLDDMPAASAIFQSFADLVRNEPLTFLEERFVETFEMTRKRPLEIGWHLYGEQYKRGEFLVKMRRMLREYGVEESQELPDHLSHCLSLLPRMEADDAEEFLANYLLPALDSLLNGFEKESTYRAVLCCLYRVFSRLPNENEIEERDEA